MPKAAVYDVNGKQVDEIDLNDRVFGAEINESVLHEVVVMQQAARRRGTASTKTIGEVRGGGRKPWRQKGTGRARVGSIRSPLWRGGAIIFGPKPRDYGYKVPKKVRRKAIRSALSSKVKNDDLLVLDSLHLENPKTREMAKILKNLKVDKKALIVLQDKDTNVILSSRNIPGITPISADSLNVYDILTHDKLVMTRDAVHRVEEVFA